MTSDSQIRFGTLVEAVLAERITREEHRELEQLLRESPALRQAYLENVGLHLDLAAMAEDADVVRSPSSALGRTPARRWGRFLATAAAAAALVMVALFNDRHERSDARTARNEPGAEIPAVSAERLPPRSPVVVEAAQARIFGQGISPRPGESLALGKEYVLTHGYLAVEFASGARVVLTAPCVFSPKESELLRVRSGQCSVYAPPGAEGFRVQTPSADVVDLGTRFVIDVAATGETDLLVVDGAASLARMEERGETRLLLREGDSARIEPEQAPQMPSGFRNSMRFTDRLPDRVVKYEATITPEGYADELLSVAVQRGGTLIDYPRDDLIRSRLVHFVGQAHAAIFCTRQGQLLPEGADRLGLLDDDWSLVTGIINPRAAAAADERDLDEPVLTVEFATPVVNGPGPDILLFELQLLVYREEGDFIRVASGDAGKEGRVMEIDHFDIDLVSPYALDLVPHKTYRAKTAPASPADLAVLELEAGRQMHVDAKGLVAGIDLSDLGYEPGESLRRLTLLDTTDGYSIDPVLIIGLPDVSPPAP